MIDHNKLLEQIETSQEFYAEYGLYPEAGPGGDQAFDAWAADVAHQALVEVKYLQCELEQLRDIAYNSGHHPCVDCGDWLHRDDMERGADNELRCTTPCHQDYEESEGDGCPGCEGGVPANCVCGRAN